MQFDTVGAPPDNDLALHTLNDLESFGLPPSPEHYLVWYRYLERRDTALAEEVNQRLAIGLPINSPFLIGLFDRYCHREDAKRDELNSAMQSLEAESSGLLGLAHSMAGSAGDFGADVNAAVFSLAQGDANERDLNAIIQALVNTATKTRQRNCDLQQQIESAAQNINEIKTFLKRVEESVASDLLTKLINRRQFTQLIEDEIALAVDTGNPLSLIICNIDKFKQFNFAFGYQVGDQALVHVASLLKRNIKGSDIAARIHDDEFAIALPNTSINAALTVAKSLRRSVGNSIFKSRKTGDDLGKITMSLGVAELKSRQTLDALFAEACEKLHQAKQSGGDKVYANGCDVADCHEKPVGEDGQANQQASRQAV